MRNLVVWSLKGNGSKSASNDTFKSCSLYRCLYGWVATVAFLSIQMSANLMFYKGIIKFFPYSLQLLKGTVGINLS